MLQAGLATANAIKPQPHYSFAAFMSPIIAGNTIPLNGKGFSYLAARLTLTQI